MLRLCNRVCDSVNSRICLDLILFVEWSKDILFRRSAVDKTGVNKPRMASKKQFVREYRVADGVRLLF